MKNKLKKSTLIFGICYLTYTWVYVLRLNLSMAAPELTGSNVINTYQIGILNSAFFVVYAFGRLLNGRLSDKTAPYIMIASGIAVCGLSNLLIGILPSFAVMVVLWSINAFAQSMLWSSVLCSVVSAYGLEKSKKMTSYMVTSVAFGNIVGIIVSSVIINKFGTGFAFVIPGGIALILSALCVIILHKIPAPEAAVSKREPIKELIKEKKVLNAAVTAFCHGIIKDNITAWVTLFFADAYNINLSEISGFILFIPLVGFLGRVIYPFIFKACKEAEHTVSLIGLAVCFICATALFIFNLTPVIAIIALSLIYMAVSLINTSLLSVFPLNFAEKGNVATVSGLMDFGTYFGAGVGSIILGYTVTLFGYSSMFILWIAASLVALMPVLKLIRENRILGKAVNH